MPVTAEQPDKRRLAFKLEPLAATSRKNSQIPLELRSLFMPDKYKAQIDMNKLSHGTLQVLSDRKKSKQLTTIGATLTENSR